MSPRVLSRPSRAAVAAVLAVSAAVPAVAVAANDAAFKAVVPYSGGRSTDLRAGEPLELFFKGSTIKKACWSPAPIQRDACGTGLAAPAKAGTQKVTLTLSGGKKVTESLTIGPRATHLPANVDQAAANDARVVEYIATCAEEAYDNYSKGTLVDPRGGLRKGDRVGAYYRAGSHTIQGIAYKLGNAQFFSDACLRPVK